MNARYKRGWFNESHRHYLAAKGITTNRYEVSKRVRRISREKGIPLSEIERISVPQATTAIKDRGIRTIEEELMQQQSKMVLSTADYEELLRLRDELEPITAQEQVVAEMRANFRFKYGPKWSENKDQLEGVEWERYEEEFAQLKKLESAFDRERYNELTNRQLLNRKAGFVANVQGSPKDIKAAEEKRNAQNLQLQELKQEVVDGVPLMNSYGNRVVKYVKTLPPGERPAKDDIEGWAAINKKIFTPGELENMKNFSKAQAAFKKESEAAFESRAELSGMSAEKVAEGRAALQKLHDEAFGDINLEGLGKFAVGSPKNFNVGSRGISLSAGSKQPKRETLFAGDIVEMDGSIGGESFVKPVGGFSDDQLKANRKAWEAAVKRAKAIAIKEDAYDVPTFEDVEKLGRILPETKKEISIGVPLVSEERIVENEAGGRSPGNFPLDKQPKGVGKPLTEEYYRGQAKIDAKVKAAKIKAEEIREMELDQLKDQRDLDRSAIENQLRAAKANDPKVAEFLEKLDLQRRLNKSRGLSK